MRASLLLALLAGCTIGVDVDEPVQVVHTIVITLPDGGAVPTQCDNLANLEISAFIEGGFCDGQQLASFTCCAFVYNTVCSISFCTEAKATGGAFCVVVGDGCQF